MGHHLYIQRSAEETRVGLVRDGSLSELEVERTGGRSLSGNVYRGRVMRLVPAMNAAFVEIGLERQGLLHAQDVWRQGVLPPRPEATKGMVDGAPPSRPKALEIGRLLEPGQEILVQVTREPVARKGPRVTMFVSLPGRNLVLLPREPHVGVSRMISDPAERQRVYSLVHRLLPRDTGAIVRTVGEGATEAELGNDLGFLREQWRDLQGRYAHASAPSFLHTDLDLTLRSLRDLVDDETERVVMNDHGDRDRVESFLRRFHPDVPVVVEVHPGPQRLFAAAGLDKQVQAALRPQVPLRDGGSLVIERTEAMTVIDVNSGARVGGSSLADGQLKLNLAAAREVARQLLLRNIGGLVAIDFVKMKRAEDRRMLEAVLEAELSTDRARVRMSRMDRFGIVMLTRKRARQSVYASLTDSCPTCDGRGYVRGASDLAIETLSRLRQTLSRAGEGEWTLRVQAPPRVAAILRGELAGVLGDLARAHGAEVIIEAQTQPKGEPDHVHLRSSQRDS